VIHGHYTNSEKEDYQFLKYVFQDNYKITMVRTRFPKFANEEACQKATQDLIEANPELEGLEVIYVDNPSREEYAAENRELSQEKLLNYLGVAAPAKRPGEADLIREIENRLKTGGLTSAELDQ
jgi:hypothetical protein